jgi:hypothetical protein
MQNSATAMQLQHDEQQLSSHAQTSSHAQHSSVQQTSSAQYDPSLQPLLSSPHPSTTASQALFTAAVGVSTDRRIVAVEQCLAASNAVAVFTTATATTGSIPGHASANNTAAASSAAA